MQQQEARGVGWKLNEGERRLVARVVGQVRARLGGRLDAELREECEVVAALVLWQAQERLAALPEAERERYTATCIRHALYHFVAGELQHRQQVISLEELAESSQRALELAEEAAAGRAVLESGPLLAQVAREELAAALRALSPRERLILDLHFVHELSDIEIAERLNVKREAVRQQRHRAIARLRKMLGAEED